MDCQFPDFSRNISRGRLRSVGATSGRDCCDIKNRSRRGGQRRERERERENMAPNEDPVAAEAPAEDAPAEKEAAVAPAEETAPVTDDAAAPPPPQQPQGEEIKGFIGGLAWEVTDNELHEEFKKYNIVSAIVATDKFSGRSRCVCFTPSPP